MSNVYSLSARRALVSRPAPVELDDDIAFPSDDSPVVNLPDHAVYEPAQPAAEPEPEPEPEPVATEPVAAEPTGDIRWHADRLELALPVATALLAFASKDTTRAHLGIGIEGSHLCATDGHTLVMFAPGNSSPRASLEREVWSRSYVETAVRVARAQKSKTVALPYTALLVEQKFPPCSQVVPEDGFSLRGPIGVNPEYLARLQAVAKACGETGVRLTSARGDLDPIAFKAGRGGTTATVVIMPMRV
jgi:hypothetical protein